jgi:hypothetical protein
MAAKALVEDPVLATCRQRLAASLQARKEAEAQAKTTPTRPFVTLTYAQSLCGSIAAVKGKPLLLSHPDSMAMTHVLRTMHSAICVVCRALALPNAACGLCCACALLTRTLIRVRALAQCWPITHP